MSDRTTRLALWSSQGKRACLTCGERVYLAHLPGGHTQVVHVDYVEGHEHFAKMT